MTGKDAYRIFKKKYPRMESTGAYEYSKCFVFKTHPESAPNSDDELKYTLFAVNKTNNDVFVFKPFMISPSDYNSGKRINNYK